MTSAMEAVPADDGANAELTVDDLAARAGVTVRNLRAYAARGLLPPPRLVGRTGFYGREHLARLLLVREMLAEGYSLAMIERTLASAPPEASSATLALHRALLAPWLPPEPEDTTGAELAARAGVPEDSGVVDQLVELGVLERLGEGGLRVLDPALLTAGLQMVALGVPPSALIEAQTRVNDHVRQIAQIYVRMFLDSGWRSRLDELATADRLDAVRTTMAGLPPTAAQALLAAFRTEMATAVEAVIGDAISQLEEE